MMPRVTSVEILMVGGGTHRSGKAQYLQCVQHPAVPPLPQLFACYYPPMVRPSSPPLPMALLALISLAPLVLLVAGLWLGGLWVLAGLIYMSLFAATLDQIGPLFDGNAVEGAEFPAADPLLIAIALGHLALLPLATYAIAGNSGLSGLERGLVFAGTGLWFGQVANPAAHELIHRGQRGLFGLGVLIYATLLFGHHASAHRLVHHRHAASAQDPSSARVGEGYYAFAARAWLGSFRKGFHAENELRARGSRRSLHPYLAYTAIAVLSLGAGWLIAGGAGVMAWAGLAVHAQSQLLLSDYVQHYGLSRAQRADGKLEPLDARHSWNAAPWFSGGMMLNAPRHSDHHVHPARPYAALRLPLAADAPRLPWSLPVACVIALVPPLWRRAMKPELAHWQTAPKSPTITPADA